MPVGYCGVAHRAPQGREPASGCRRVALAALAPPTSLDLRADSTRALAIEEGRLLARCRIQLIGKRHWDDDQGIGALVGHGLEIGKDAAARFSVFGLTEAARDLLLDLNSVWRGCW